MENKRQLIQLLKIQNSKDKTESDTPDKRKLPVTVILGDSMVKDIKG